MSKECNITDEASTIQADTIWSDSGWGDSQIST
ncbi:MAG: hypothetical protein A07HR60_01301 [uncultured archaeon A07HR60]|jgi:hypothetical protein|nr:MAG: hypothetical protein A07HR60_01301 [uncultured archaeon A07HR60]